MGKPTPDLPVSWWGWCSVCGQCWSPSGCPHPPNMAFPDQDAVEAAAQLGGSEAVWDIERKLHAERVEADIQAFRTAIRPMAQATGRIPIAAQLRAKQKRKKRTRRS